VFSARVRWVAAPGTDVVDSSIDLFDRTVEHLLTSYDEEQA